MTAELKVSLEIVPYPLNPSYGVTRDGRVFRIGARPFSPPPPVELRPWQCNGYAYVTLSDRRKATVHRMLAETFLGPCPEGCTDVAHKDGVRDHNTVENLRWDTRAGNFADKPAHGTDNRGEKNPHAKLLAQDVRRIRLRRAGGERGSDLAREYAVTGATICDITKGRSWTHV